VLSVTSPGSAARSYAQLCGIATGLDLIGERWALLIVRDLLLGPLRFGDLAEGLPGIGTNTLTARLKQLETTGVIARRLLARPDRGIAYELTDYGRELEPILMALGRWGTRSMNRLPEHVTARSRWLVAAMLAFHDEAQALPGPTTWELRLRDGTYTAQAVGATFTVRAGAPDDPDVIATIDDEDLHQLLTGHRSVAQAISAGRLTVHGEAAGLQRLIDLCAFR
jgi:DNA-binding HxlR family transcriptional regulator